MARLLVVDDDEDLCELLGEYLTLEGFTVEVAHQGEQGLRLALQEPFDLLILDVMLPGLNGFDLLKALREQSRLPVLMMTARGEEIDRVVGLEIGADDYLPKPCSPRELVARVRAILRRAQYGTPEPEVGRSTGSEWRAGDLMLSLATRQGVCAGSELELTYTEFELLVALMRSAGELVSREQLSRSVLKRPLGPFDRSLDMHLSNLRRKLGPLRSGESRIQTVRGAGYLLRIQEPGPVPGEADA